MVDFVGAVAITANGRILARAGLFGTDVVALMALEAHCIDLVALKADVRRRSANVFVVRVTCTETVTADTSDFCPEVSLAQLLFDECHVAHVAGRIGAEGIGLVELRGNISSERGGSNGGRAAGT